MKRLGRRIQKERAAKKLSLREVAAKARVSYTSVANAEKGTARPDTARAVARALGIPAAEVVKLLVQDVQTMLRRAA